MLCSKEVDVNDGGWQVCLLMVVGVEVVGRSGYIYSGHSKGCVFAGDGDCRSGQTDI